MKHQEMFKEGEPRYITRGIHDSLPVICQILLWDAIDNLRDSGQRLDYLQIFRLRTIENPDRDGKILIIRHFQEQPAYSMEYKIPVRKDSVSINGKIYVIDDIDHATMLWAEEY